MNTENSNIKCDFYRYQGDYNWHLDYSFIWCYLFRCCKRYNGILNIVFRCLFWLLCQFRGIEISSQCKIGEGFYMGHQWGITINQEAILGKNINIHKGVTIGQENRGVRRGTPILGNMIWIGVNSTIVGKINVGDDVLIAPNSFVNFDVPSHSIVIGNKIIHRDEATTGYINNVVK